MNILDSPEVQPGDQASTFAHRLLTKKSDRVFRLVSVNGKPLQRASYGEWPLIVHAELDWDEIRIILAGREPVSVKYDDCLIVEAVALEKEGSPSDTSTW